MSRGPSIEMAFLMAICLIAINALSILLFFRRSLSRLLAFSVFGATVLWYTTPGMLGLLWPELSLWRRWVSADQFCRAFVIEALAMIAVLVLLNVRRGTGATVRMADFECNRKVRSVIIVGFLVVNVYLWHESSLDYLLNNAADMLYANRQGYLLTKMLYFLSDILTICVLLYYIEAPKGFISHVCLGLLTSQALLGVLSGGTLALLLPLIAFLLKGTRGLWFGPTFSRRLIFVFGTVFLVFPIIVTIHEIRTEKMSARGIASGYDVRLGSEVYARTLLHKLDWFSAGYILVSKCGAGAAGIKPYIGSALVWIPRAMLPARPVAGSIDGTYAGHPSRVVPKTMHASLKSANVGVAPAHIAIWHFGYAGVLLFVGAAYGYLRLADRLLQAPSAYERVLGVYTLTIPSFAGVFSAPDVVLKNGVIICVLLLARHLFLSTRSTSVRQELIRIELVGYPGTS